MEREEKNKKMIIKKMVVGFFRTNCYLVADEDSRETVIIDPGDKPDKISAEIKKENLKPKFILLTHKHPDHIGAVEEIKNIWPYLTAQAGDVLRLKNGENIKIGEIEIKIIETPGHTPDSVCFIFEKEAVIFTGDTLFRGAIGKTDLEGGDFDQIQKSLKRLMEFSDNFKIFPGHGEETTIREEKENNSFLKI